MFQPSLHNQEEFARPPFHLQRYAQQYTRQKLKPESMILYVGF